MNDSLSAPFETDPFTFQAIAGQRLYFDTCQTTLGTYRQRLLGPDGQTVFDSTTDIGVGPFTISQSGRYTLLIGGTEAAAGNYSFRLFDVLSQPTLAFDTLITDATIDGVEADLFRFTGAAEQMEHVNTTSPSFNARARLYDTANTLLATVVVGQGQAVTLPPRSCRERCRRRLRDANQIKKEWAD